MVNKFTDMKRNPYKTGLLYSYMQGRSSENGIGKSVRIQIYFRRPFSCYLP